MSTLKTRYKSPVANIFSRPQQRENPKLIFISCEGPVTEEIYFDIVSQIFEKLQNKIKIASVRDDFFSLKPSNRTQFDIDEQNKSAPRQVLERLDNYLARHKYRDSDNNPDDEFWLILDVDDHTSENKIEEWNAVLAEAKSKNYQIAVSNPFFEVWLLLHHVDVNREDRKYAVTKFHRYQKTDHFVRRLKECAGAPLRGNNHKVPHAKDYNKRKIRHAIQRAKALHTDKNTLWPRQLGTTVYILLEKIMMMV